jgi:alcohol dehydrogenase, propanol-preferring
MMPTESATAVQPVGAAGVETNLGTMQAAVVESFDRPLVVKEIAIPTPGPGQVLVRIETSGLCHTDIHAAKGHWPIQPKLPLIPGHEGVGIITQVGAGVTNVKEGDRVGLPWLGFACGACEYCASGWETLCEKQLNTGYFLDGGYAQYAVAFANYVAKVPDGIDPLDAAPLTCAGVTTYKAVKVSGARSSDLVAVFGIGGLGHLAMQYAKAAGAAVAAVDLTDEKLALAKELGADFTINGRNEDPAAAIKKLGGADAAISVAVSPKAFEQAYRSLRRGGTLVFVALPQDNFMQLPIFETVLNGINIKGSIVGTRVDLQETYELHQMGKTRVIRETARLEDVNHWFEEVEQAKVKARIVFDLR